MVNHLLNSWIFFYKFFHKSIIIHRYILWQFSQKKEQCIGAHLAPDWTITPSLWSYRVISWISVQKKCKKYFCWRVEGQFNHFTALSREYRNKRPIGLWAAVSRNCSRVLSQEKPKKLEKTATNHLDLPQITGFLVKLLCILQRSYLHCT